MDASESPGGSDASDTLKSQVDNWSSNTTDALEISLFRGEEEIAQFGPEFTYPIFGEEEAVFGYKGLSISLSFASHDLKPHVEIAWDEQWKQQGDIQASDVKGALEEFLPASAFLDESAPTTTSSNAAAGFSPPGARIKSYKNGNGTFEIWCSSLADPLAKEMMQNAQVLVPLFIEGGTELSLEHDWVNERWTVFLLYQIHEKSATTCPYSLVGYSTAYRVFTLPDRWNPSATSLALLQHDGQDLDSIISQSPTAEKPATSLKSPLELPSRERISQFLVLPPYQGSGHGAHLYNTMYTHLIAPANILELTVEDPNEAFDDLRDACDLVYLRENNDDFASLAINTTIDAAKMRSTATIPTGDIVSEAATSRIKTASKIMPRQFSRLTEMQTLSKIPPNHRSVNRISRKEKSSNEMDRAYFFWRLFVKQRLYAANRDTLSTLDREERIEKLEATVDVVQDDYVRLLALADKRAKQASKDDVIHSSHARKTKKRKTVVESDDDSAQGIGSDDAGDQGVATAGPPGPKKRKLASR